MALTDKQQQALIADAAAAREEAHEARKLALIAIDKLNKLAAALGHKV